MKNYTLYIIAALLVACSTSMGASAQELSADSSLLQSAVRPTTCMVQAPQIVPPSLDLATPNHLAPIAGVASLPREFGIATPRRLFTDDVYTFRPTQLIVPLALIAVGTSSLYIKGIDNLDHKINSCVSLRYGRLTYDDYLQYLPLASVLVLDACGVKSRNAFKEQATIILTSVAFQAALTNIGKYTIRRMRPDGSSRNSSPSGHTATAFMGAELLHMEYGGRSPWISAAGYTVATLTGLTRIYNNRHFLTDVIFGAGVGILSVRMAYWVAPWLNRVIWGSDVRSRRVYTAVAPYVEDKSYGVAMSMKF